MAPAGSAGPRRAFAPSLEPIIPSSTANPAAVAVEIAEFIQAMSDAEQL
jgi:hypothetical protein